MYDNASSMGCMTAIPHNSVPYPKTSPVNICACKRLPEI